MIEILPLSEEYLTQVTELDKKIFPHSPWGEDSFRNNMINEYDHPVIAVDNGKVAGYGVLRQIDTGEILLIGVDPERRREGIGRMLLKGMLDTADLGENIFLEVRESNTAARRLYLSQGFMQIARRRGYYKNPTEDAVIMMV